MLGYHDPDENLYEGTWGLLLGMHYWLQFWVALYEDNKTGQNAEGLSQIYPVTK